MYVGVLISLKKSRAVLISLVMWRRHYAIFSSEMRILISLVIWGC